MGLSRSLIAGSVLCVFACASLAPVSAQTVHGGTNETHDSGNALQFVPGILNAIHDARKRKEARRKAAAERAKQEQEQEQQPPDDAVANPPAVPPVVKRPVYHPRPVHRLKPRPHRPAPPVTQTVLTPTPVPATVAPPVVTQPALPPAPGYTTGAPSPTVTPPSPALHVQAARPMPKVIVPLDEPDRGWLLIFLAVAAAGVVGAAGYVFRGALGFVPPPPAARAFADTGTSSAPVFEKDGPQISFMIALPAFTTTSDYPEPTK